MAVFRNRRRSRAWHRWLGLVAALPLLLVCVTGLILNHTADLGLDQRRTNATPILSRYGMTLNGEPRTFAAGRHRVSQWEDRLFLDGQVLDSTSTGLLVGAVAIDDDMTAVVLEPAIILLYEQTGVLVDSLDDATLNFGPIARAGLSSDGRLVVEDREGRFHGFTRDLLTYETREADPGASEPDVGWSMPLVTNPPALRKQMAVHYFGGGVPWSRVLLDLHTGKLFGLTGRTVVDVLTLCVIILIFTGLRLGIGSRS